MFFFNLLILHVSLYILEVQLFMSVSQTCALRAQYYQDACQIAPYPLLLATRERDDKSETEWPSPSWVELKILIAPSTLNVSPCQTTWMPSPFPWMNIKYFSAEQRLALNAGYHHIHAYFLFFFCFFLDLLQGRELFWPWTGPLQPEREGSEAGKWDHPHVHRPLPGLHVLLHLAR